MTVRADAAGRAIAATYSHQEQGPVRAQGL